MARLAARVGNAAADGAHREKEQEGQPRAGGPLRVGQVKQRRADTGGKPAGPATEQQAGQQADGIRGLQLGGAGGGGDPDAQKHGADKHHRGHQADNNDTVQGKTVFLHKTGSLPLGGRSSGRYSVR